MVVTTSMGGTGPPRRRSRRVEQTLRERDETLALAEQSAGIGAWDVELASGMVRYTPQFFRIMGLEPTSDPVPIERVRALRHREGRERVVAGFRRAVASGADTYEAEYRIAPPTGGRAGSSAAGW